MMVVGLIAYGAGNFTSVRNALEHLKLEVLPVSSESEFDQASHLVLPGVDAFPTAMRQLRKRGVVDGIRNQVRRRSKPLLGICVVATCDMVRES